MRPIRHNSFRNKDFPFVLLRQELALFRTNAPVSAVLPALDGQCLLRPGRGQLGSFGAMNPSDGSIGEFGGPRPSRSVSANWVCLYHWSRRRFRRRPRPSASAPAPAWRLALFRTHWFGVPRSRGSDRSFPPQGGTPNGPRSPLGSLRLWDRSSTRTRVGPLTTKPSKVVVAYLCVAILLPDYHTAASIPRQVKCWTS